MAKKRWPSTVPRHKRLTRRARLDAAQHWLLGYSGKHLVRAYKRHFGVDLECALVELQQLKISLADDYVAALRQSEHCRLAHRRRAAVHPEAIDGMDAEGWTWGSEEWAPDLHAFGPDWEMEMARAMVDRAVSELSGERVGGNPWAAKPDGPPEICLCPMGPDRNGS